MNSGIAGLEKADVFLLVGTQVNVSGLGTPPPPPFFPLTLYSRFENPHCKTLISNYFNI